jgi:three-Cys-motif partner protein
VTTGGSGVARDKASYQGREQAFVKHYLLEKYLERLFHKTGRSFDTIVYVDGYSGPWQSQGQNFDDTSFGIALGALRKAKASWAANGRPVHVEAHLVEKSRTAYRELETIKAKYPDIKIQTYLGDFRNLVGEIADQISTQAFSFILIDPKGRRLNLQSLVPLIGRKNSEVLFNFMFEFINRAASMQVEVVSGGLDELIPVGGWRNRLQLARTAKERKQVLIDAFSASLAQFGGYDFVAETPILRPIKDRTLYSLIYATRKPVGLEVFRDCQVPALEEQSQIRGEAKVRNAVEKGQQEELFSSFNEMAPDDTLVSLNGELTRAEDMLLALVPSSPASVSYGEIWPQVLTRHVVRKMHVGEIAARLKADGRIIFLDWPAKKRRPEDSYRMSRPIS